MYIAPLLGSSAPDPSNSV